VVVLDWDCTITAQHMHKDTGKRDRSRGGMHSEHFEDWCQHNGVDSSRSRAGLSAVDKFDFGPDTERVVVEYFFGGSERVAQLTAFFEWLKAQGVQLCILTSGETAAVRQLFDAGIAPWAALFGAGGWIANTYDEYFVTEEDGRVGTSPLPSRCVFNLAEFSHWLSLLCMDVCMQGTFSVGNLGLVGDCLWTAVRRPFLTASTREGARWCL
jgi:hypothetical protein